MRTTLFTLTTAVTLVFFQPATSMARHHSHCCRSYCCPQPTCCSPTPWTSSGCCTGPSSGRQLTGVPPLATMADSTMPATRAPRLFDLYAPPGNVWSGWTTVASPLSVIIFNIELEAGGDTNVVGEVRFFDSHDKQVQLGFSGNIEFRTGPFVQNVDLRVKAVGGTGTPVRASVTP